ncbi:MAG: hypothetical protein KatS3mg008_0901 [Acidimicrobiales bacterium]|nr:MAG: hypothetical protein KatS3mg008_0901 [Acidimicrobiales bacterium]
MDETSVAPDDCRPGEGISLGEVLFYKLLGHIGRALITAGVLLLAFVAYQLWGTRLYADAAQTRLEERFEAALDKAADARGNRGERERVEDGLLPREGEVDDPRPTASEGLAEATVASSIADVRGGDPLGRIQIPEIDSDWIFVEGVDLAWLRNGPGHFPGTSLPGQRGNAALAGHRTTYGAPFHRIDELKPGDLVRVTTLQGRFTYRVLPLSVVAERTPPLRERVGSADADKGWFVVRPDEVWILDDYGDSRLTLMACHPKYSARQRIVVVAELTDEPAETVSTRVEADVTADALLGGELDLLEGDRKATFPALAWGVAAGSVWLMAWAVARRLHKWLTYAICFPAFAACTFVCFTYVERLLPAGY